MSIQEHHKKRINMLNQEHHEKKGSIMSNQEHHEKRINNVNSKASRKKESLCQFKSTTKKRIIMSNQEHHEKKGSIMSNQEHHVKSNVSQPSHICVIANHFDCNVRSNKSTMRRNTNIKKHNAKKGRISLQMYQQYQGI